jgi:tetratricopeptide (TPR) repeat protein
MRRFIHSRRASAVAALTAAYMLALSPSMAWALDEVHVTDKEKPIRGNVSLVSRSEVTVDTAGQSSKIPVSKVKYIVFQSDPLDKDAREEAKYRGAYAATLAKLEKIKAADASRPEIRADLEFFSVYCKGQLALGGKPGYPIKGTAGEVLKFINANPESFHYYEAVELLGDLLRAGAAYSKAVEYYNKLAENRDFAQRAAVAVGWTLLEQKQTAQAQKSFETALEDKTSGAEADYQRSAATLGKAVCAAESGKADEAVKAIDDVIAKADPEDTVLHARAYNALGRVQQKANQPKAALMAYLHVDIMYSQDSAEHAEALGNLARLWIEVNHPERATDAARRLKSSYPDSRWAQR